VSEGFNILVPIALIGFIPFSLILFILMPAQRAVAATLVLGFLFLPPNAQYPLPGLPDYGKYNAIAYAALLGALLFDASALLRFRPAWYDLPMVAFIVAPGLASLSNGLGFNDALSSTFRVVTTWGLAYFLSRVYFANLAGVRDLAIWMVIGAILYIPLCLYEARFSPQLNLHTYGYYQHDFNQTKRYGGFRPMVYMNHGLMVGLWMCAATFVAAMLWQSRSVSRIMHMPMSVCAIALGFTAVLCKSFGALSLLLLALVVGMLSRKLRAPMLVLGLLALPVGYMATRGTDLWSGQELIDISAAMGGQERGGSLQVRIQNEDVLIDHALKQPIFGWGGWERNRPGVRAEAGFRIITDGYWVIVLGQRGLFGLAAYVLIMGLPVVLFLWRWRMLAFTHPWLAPALALCLVQLMYLTDLVFNAMINPLYTVGATALLGLTPTPQLLARMRLAMAPPQPQPEAISQDPGPAVGAVAP
jgi:hypothetical protein